MSSGISVQQEQTMHPRSTRSFFYKLSVLLMVLQCIVALPLQAQMTSQALSLPPEDIIAPKVVHQSSDRGMNPNGTYFFNADVTDDVGVQSVTLFYRTVGEPQYIAIPMGAFSDGAYSALLAPDAVKPPGIEYYLQAKDISGNAVLVGAAFSPLKMDVTGTAATPAASQASSEGSSVANHEIDTAFDPSAKKDSSEGKSSSKKWWWIAAGVVAVGVIAASSGGGGGGSDPAPPTTGGITVTAPLPQ
jgi:hypothetical protein